MNDSIVMCDTWDFDLSDGDSDTHEPATKKSRACFFLSGGESDTDSDSGSCDISENVPCSKIAGSVRLF